MRGARLSVLSSAAIESSASSLRAARAAEAHVAQAAIAGRPKPESSGSRTRLGMLPSRSMSSRESAMRGARISVLSSVAIESSIVGRELEGDEGG